jgi:spore coat protein H
MNIADYMRKMAFDYIIKNGDYTDEIYFYGSKKNDSIYFDIIPWDYDDIFADLAHEVVTDGYTGKVFGIRKYNNEDQHNETLNDRLVFSIEDDLDYIITIDDYMYSKYLEELRYVLSIINEHSVASAFAQVRSELDNFYDSEEIIAQSIYDKNETNKELYENNIQQKETFLINRIKDIGIKLNEQISKH